MRRVSYPARSGWQRTVESQGLIYHTPNGRAYWDESAYYEFSSAEIDKLEAATNELQQMFLAVGQRIIDRNLFRTLHIPEHAERLIRATWEKEPPAIYGRMDLAFDGTNIKLLEYNADTPTALLEAAVVQWYWLQDSFPHRDQFNSLHERLIAKWKELRDYLPGVLVFAHLDDAEDWTTITYLQDTALQAGFQTANMLIKDIGVKDGKFVDIHDEPLLSCFKLYPWEWMVHEEYGALLESNDTLWVEPIWKMMWSNKGILPLLWEQYPHHRLLLECYFDSPRQMQYYAKKPLLSREGNNIALVTPGGTIARDGDYGEEGFVYQELAPVKNFNGNYPVIGSWLIDGESAGMGIRESETMITDNLSRFVPHIF